MDDIKEFFESSTIHGLAYICTTGKYVRLFWILVVITGFSAAGVLINQSFQAWSLSPISTTVETRPISEITFPKVTVCPPKDTYTDLNYDLMMIENMTLDTDTRNELKNYALEQLNNHLYETIKKDLNFLTEEDRFYNWYLGYTKLQLPYQDDEDEHAVTYHIETFAESGHIATQYFGDKFDADKVKPNYNFYVTLKQPEKLVKGNATLNLEMYQVRPNMVNMPRSYNKLYINEEPYRLLNTFISKVNPLKEQLIQNKRKFPSDDIKEIRSTKQSMPGFEIKWKYTGANMGRWRPIDNRPIPFPNFSRIWTTNYNSVFRRNDSFNVLSRIFVYICVELIFNSYYY